MAKFLAFRDFCTALRATAEDRSLTLAGTRRHGRLEGVHAAALPNYFPAYALDDLVSSVHINLHY
jgi:hypothetical protein